MLAMPTPVAWGDKAKPATGRGRFRLEKGEIFFEVLHARIFPERPIYRRPVEDKVIGSLSEDIRRPILPAQEESPGLDTAAPDAEPTGREIADYSRPGDADAIFSELLDQIRTLNFRLIAGGMITLFLGLIELLPMFGLTMPDMLTPERAPIVYLSINLALGGFCAFLCRRVMIGGFSAMIRRRPDGDSVTAAACTAVLLHTAVELIVYIITREPVGRVCCAPMTLALLLNDAGLLAMARRVARSFRFVTVRGVKSAARLVGDDMSFDEIMHADRQHRTRVAYCVRAKFLSHYLGFAYEEDFCEQMFRRLTPYVLLPVAIAAVVGGIVGAPKHGVWSAIYCLCAALCVSIPSCRLLCLNLPLGRVSKRLLRHGAMLNGWAAVDEFGRTDTLAVASETLFPRGSVRLLSIKPLGEEPVTRTVRYAASVVLAAGGPLAQVFEELLEGRRDRVLPAEGIDYENEMGVSGFVESLPVLVGNRRMLKAHGCELPSKDYESLLTGGDNRSLVYIAISGVPCAVLLVKYSADAETIHAVQQMAEAGVSLVVYTCDANVTARMLSRIYCIPPRCITMLSTRTGSEYDRLTHVIRDSSPAVLATDGSMRALAESMTAARRLHVQLTLATILQTVTYGLMLTLTTLLCCLSGSGGISPAQLMLLELLCLIPALVPTLRRVL